MKKEKKKEKKKDEEEKEEIEPKIYVHVLILGDECTGKSSLINYYLEGYFSYSENRYSGYGSKTIDTTEGKITLIFSEFDGRVRPINEMCILPAFDHFPSYREVFSIYNRKMDYIILLYDVTNKRSFEGLNEYLELIQKNKSQNPKKIYILATKTDVFEEKIKVTIEEGQKFAEEKNLFFQPVSCIDSYGRENIEKVFKDVANHYITTEDYLKKKEENKKKQEEEEKKKQEEKKHKCIIY